MMIDARDTMERGNTSKVKEALAILGQVAKKLNKVRGVYAEYHWVCRAEKLLYAALSDSHPDITQWACKCGASVNGNWAYCPQCGSRVSDKEGKET